MERGDFILILIGVVVILGLFAYNFLLQNQNTIKSSLMGVGSSQDTNRFFSQDSTQVNSSRFIAGEAPQVDTLRYYAEEDKAPNAVLSSVINWRNLQGFPAGCPVGEAVQIIGSSFLTCVPVGSAGSCVDTNWQTSWNIFDANMKNTFVPYTGASKNVNLGGNTLSITGGICASIYCGDIPQLPVSPYTYGIKSDGGLIVPNGLVGIGTAKPTNTLTVKGDSNVTGTSWFGNNTFRGNISSGATGATFSSWGDYQNYNLRIGGDVLLTYGGGDNWGEMSIGEEFGFTATGGYSGTSINAGADGSASLNTGSYFVRVSNNPQTFDVDSLGDTWGHIHINEDVDVQLESRSATTGLYVKDEGVGINTITPKNALNVVGDANITSNLYAGKTKIVGDVNQSGGNAYFNAIYGAMYNKNDAGFGTLVVPVANTYVRVTGLVLDGNNGVNFSDSNLLIVHSGIYQMLANVSLTAGGSSEYGVTAFLNDQNYDNCYAHETVASNQTSSLAISCFLRANSGDKVNVRVDDHSAPANDAILKSVNVSVLRVGN